VAAPIPHPLRHRISGLPTDFGAEHTTDLSTESFCSAGLRLCGFFFAIPGRCIRMERTKQASRNLGYFVDGSHEQAFIRLRRFGEAADFSNELERSGTNLFGSNWWFEIKKDPDIPAHSL
jgi:hypothetical protein